MKNNYRKNQGSVIRATMRTVGGVNFKFVRRTYGHAGHHKTFTWLHYQDENDAWQDYGDPWPSVSIPLEDLERIAKKLKAKVAPEIEMCEICEMFDVQVLQDYWAGTDDCPESGHPMFSLGQRSELAAGLRGFTMTPWFDTMEKLYSFCQRNINKFREIIKADSDAPAPDATNWV